MPVIRFIHAAALRLTALALLVLAFLTLGAARVVEGQGAALPGHAPGWAVPVAGLAGLFLLLPYWLPQRLRFPRRWADMVMLMPLSALCWLGGAMAADLAAVASAARDVPGGPIAIGGAAAALLAGLTALRIHMRQRWAERMLAELAAQEAEARWEGVEADYLEGDAPEAESAPESAPKPKGPRRDWLALGHLALIRIAGMAVFGATAFAAATLAQPVFAAMAGAVAGFLAGLVLLSDRVTPRVLARPDRVIHLPVVLLLAAVLTVLAAVPHAMPLLAPVVAASLAEGAVLVPGPRPVGALVAAQPLVVAISAVVFAGALALSALTGLFLVLRALISGPPLPEVAPGELPPIEARQPRAGGLPAIGAAMKLYVIADWLVLRLLGLGLLGTGYILWQMLQTDRDYQAAALSLGQQPLHALIGYGIAGTLMTLPFLLPRFIAQPSHVLGGLMKALLLVGACLALLPALKVAITLFTPDMYHATLITTAPNLFKAIAGVAITSALLISFFRQLGALPKTDYKGEEKIDLSAEDLRAMRIARMAVGRETG